MKKITGLALVAFFFVFVQPAAQAGFLEDTFKDTVDGVIKKGEDAARDEVNDRIDRLDDKKEQLEGTFEIKGVTRQTVILSDELDGYRNNAKLSREMRARLTACNTNFVGLQLVNPTLLIDDDRYYTISDADDILGCGELPEDTNPEDVNEEGIEYKPSLPRDIEGYRRELGI